MRWLFLVVSLVALPGLASAQNGKLSGVVTDEVGDPVPGATVVLVGTQQGAASDEEGRYVIIGVDPGTYSVRASFVGYATQVVTDLLITSNRTTTLDFELSTEVIQGGEVVVVAEEAVVDQNQTTSRAIVTGEEISNLPVANLDEVISRTSNSYDGFVRGSRRFETRTVVEGIDVSDSFYSLAAGTNYEGSRYGNVNRADKTSASILSINPAAVQEVTVNSGATEPQYNAGSGGVVAVTLAERSGPIRGTVSARIAPTLTRPGPDSLAFYRDAQDYFDDAELVEDPLKRSLYTWTEDKYDVADDPEIDVRFTAGGSITDDWTFSTAGQWFKSGGYLPNYSRQRINGQLKSTYSISPQTQLTAIAIVEDKGLWGGWNNTDYIEQWRFYLEGVAQQDAGSYLGSLRLRQVLSPTSYVTAQAYRTYDRTRYGYVDDDGNGFQDIGEDGDFLDFFDPAVVDRYISTSSERDEEENPRMFIDVVTDDLTQSNIFLPNGNRYRLARPAPFSEDAISAVYGLEVDYANQITFNHFIQSGVEFKLREFDYELVDGLPGPGAILNDEEEPFRFSQWDRNPWDLSLYASDRIEYGGLVANVGARLSFVNRDMEKIDNFFYPFVRDSIETASGVVARNRINRGDAVPVDVLFNPSIGIAHPIGTTASMYFSFSRSQQLPPYSQLYRYYDGIQTTSRFFNMVDPEQDPITSNNYELGVQWEFLPGWGADINAYTRSIDNYTTTTLSARNFTPEGEPTIDGFSEYSYTTNLGYADARGIELVVRRRPLRLAPDLSLGLTASYTYSSVEQSNSTGTRNQTSFNFDPADGETTLPFDDAEDFENFAQDVRGGSTITGGYGRRHRGTLRGLASFPYDITLGLLSTFESGFEYPRALGGDARNRSLITAPTNFQIDLRLEKGLAFTDRFGIDFYLDVVNLTNRDNVIAYENYTPNGPVVFQETGVPGSRLVRDDGAVLYGPSRAVYFGSRLRF